MQCKEINSLIMKYFDGNASELEREMIVKHNKECSRCAEEFAVLREAIDIIEEFPEVEVPVGFESRVMEGIRNQGAYSLNPRIVAFWLISVLGLMIFAWNIVTFVAIPFIMESGMLIAAQNVLIYGFNVISGILSQVVITVSVMLGKILVIRSVLLRDYVISLTLVAMAFMGINLILIHRLKLREN